MKRRTLFRTVIQTALAAPALVAAQQAPVPHDEFAKIDTATSAASIGESVLQFFSKAEFAALEKLAAAILPSVNGKPGALEAGVPAFLDFLLSQSPAPKQKLYRDGIARLIAGATLDPLKDPWTYAAPTDPFKRFLREAKIEIVQATFNSREWIEARSGGRGSTGTYYLAVD